MRRHLSWIVLGSFLFVVSLWVAYQVFFDGNGLSVSRITQEESPAPSSDAGPETLPELPAPSFGATAPGFPQGMNEQAAGPSNIEYRSRYGELPESLRGVEMPAIRADGEGNLVLDRNLRDIFEFFMTEIGDEPREVVLGRIRELLEHRVGEKAALQGGKVLNDYVEYRDYMTKVMEHSHLEDPAPLGDREAVVDALKDMRRIEKDARLRFLGEKAATSFFAEQEEHEDYFLLKLEIESDPSLSAEEKAAEVGTLDEQYKNRYRIPF